MSTGPQDGGSDGVGRSDELDHLVERIEGYAGECTGAEPPTVRGGNRGYAIAFYENPADGMVTAVSNGLRFQSIRTVAPQELVCSVRPDQLEAGRYLVDLAAGQCLERGEGLEWGTPADNGQPLLTGTGIHGFLASTHPYFDEAFNAVVSRDDGRTLVRFITLIPATGPELALATDAGEEALFERWVAAETDLLDVARDSAV